MLYKQPSSKKQAKVEHRPGVEDIGGYVSYWIASAASDSSRMPGVVTVQSR